MSTDTALREIVFGDVGEARSQRKQAIVEGLICSPVKYDPARDVFTYTELNNPTAAHYDALLVKGAANLEYERRAHAFRAAYFAKEGWLITLIRLGARLGLGLDDVQRDVLKTVEAR